MGAFTVVKIEVGPDATDCLGHGLVGLQIYLLVLQASPQPLDEHVVYNRPLPSVLIRIPRSWRTLVKSSLVNWAPSSVLKISGVP